MKTKSIKTIIFSLIIFLSSCMVTKTSVGDYRTQAGEETVFAKSKQFYFLGNRMGETNTATPQSKDCLIKTKKTFGDMLFSAVTLGLFQSTTIIVYVKSPPVK